MKSEILIWHWNRWHIYGFYKNWVDMSIMTIIVYYDYHSHKCLSSILSCRLARIVCVQRRGRVKLLLHSFPAVIIYICTIGKHHYITFSSLSNPGPTRYKRSNQVVNAIYYHDEKHEVYSFSQQHRPPHHAILKLWWRSRKLLCFYSSWETQATQA